MKAFWARLRIFAADIKLSHTVFALPFALLSLFLATRGKPGWPLLGLILLCMVSARTVAMSANRLLDARLDALNPRTAGRAIPSGRLPAGYFIAALLLNVSIFFAACYGFYAWRSNPWPLWLGGPVLAWISLYPLLKRFSLLCHYYLGMSLALAPLCAWVAATGTVAWPPVWMAAAVLLWTAGFDILYACQDVQSDRRTGVISVPARMGIGPSLWIARLSHLGALGMLFGLGWTTADLSWNYGIALAVAAALLLWEHTLVRAGDLSKLNVAFFTLNGIISVILAAGGITDTVLAGW